MYAPTCSVLGNSLSLDPSRPLIPYRTGWAGLQCSRCNSTLLGGRRGKSLLLITETVVIDFYSGVAPLTRTVSQHFTPIPLAAVTSHCWIPQATLPCIHTVLLLSSSHPFSSPFLLLISLYLSPELLYLSEQTRCVYAGETYCTCQLTGRAGNRRHLLLLPSILEYIVCLPVVELVH